MWDEPVVAVAPAGPGLVAARAGSGDLHWSPGGSGGDWRVAATLPAPIVELHEWGSELLAVTTIGHAASPRRTLWRAALPAGDWRPLLAVVDRAPLVLCLDDDRGYVVAGGTVFRIDRGGSGRPVRSGRIALESTPAVVFDVCTVPGPVLVAATSLGPLASTDEGASWTELASGRTTPCVSVAAVGSSVVFVDEQAQLWRAPAPRPVTRKPWSPR
jgi:hypothetical protein